MDEYNKQANDFLESTGAKIEITFKKYGAHFAEDKEKRDIYSVKITRNKRSYTFDFGNSLNDSGLKVVNENTGKLGFVISTEDYMRITKNETDKKTLKFKLNYNNFIKLRYRLESCDKLIPPKKPDNYSVLACLTKYDPESFEFFCGDFGYDEDSRSAEKTYKAVVKEYQNLARLFNDEELEAMAEIN